MNVIQEIKRINDVELEKGLVNTNASWHAQYAKSSWVFIGGLDGKLSEGDVICIMSQYGEVEDINLVRDDVTGESKGFAFLKYEDARSCVLAVDNLCGSIVLDKSLRVDHVEKYRLPKHLQEKEDMVTSSIHHGAGHAHQNSELESNFDINTGQDLFAEPSSIETGNKRKFDAEDTANAKDEAKRARKAEREMKRQEKARRHKEREEKRNEKRSRKESKRTHERGKRKHSTKGKS